MTDPAAAPTGPSPLQAEAGVEGAMAYADAMAELEAILDALEADRVDVDTLAANVERAAALIRLCRARLVSARAKVDAIVGDLEEGGVADGDG